MKLKISIIDTFIFQTCKIKLIIYIYYEYYELVVNNNRINVVYKSEVTIFSIC